jgi:hypothetical protein
LSEITKALSIRPPWWWAILYAGKDIENRDWPTSYRGPVWIHASKWWSKKGIGENLEDAAEMAERSGVVLPPIDLDWMQRQGGHIVGSILIVDCVERSSSPWFVGRFGLVLRNPVPLADPVPYKGSLGLFSIPSGLIGDAA